MQKKRCWKNFHFRAYIQNIPKTSWHINKTADHSINRQENTETAPDSIKMASKNTERKNIHLEITIFSQPHTSTKNDTKKQYNN